jgi:zinc transporter ZupT
MLRLALIMYSLISTTLAGSFVVAALATGNDTLQPILLAAAAGAILALPISWFVTKAILENE